MKKALQLFSIWFPFFFLQHQLFAQNDNNKKYEFVKSKAVNKTYNVSSSDKLNIDNSFGDVEVHTWSKNEIKVDVTIEVSANSEALAQKMIDGISVADSRSEKEVKFKTTINPTINSTTNGDKITVNGQRKDKGSMKVNYQISMPASNPLEIVNQFGATVLPDYKGEVELSSKFGSLTTGSLSNVKSVNVEFGHAKIESIFDGPVSIKYSSAEIGKLSGKIKLDLEFSSATKINIDNSLTSLDAKVSYSTVNIRPVGDLSASYSIFTSFGSFKNRSNIKFESDEDNNEGKGPKFDHNYNGKSGNGAIPIKLNTSFGKIILGEATEDDMKDKEKTKSKTRTTT